METNVHRQESAESGLGLVEIMVAMLLLALLAMAVLPVLVQGMKGASANAIRATASQLVGGELDLVRVLDPNCDTVSAFDDIAPPIVTDDRGVDFEIHRSVGACPAAAAYPGVVEVRIEVKEVGAAPQRSLKLRR